MNDSGASAGRPEEPLVSCDDCGFGWHGQIAADGLRVIGHCPRCQGRLAFREELSDEAAQRREESRRGQQPWQVLGTPYSWAR